MLICIAFSDFFSKINYVYEEEVMAQQYNNPNAQNIKKRYSVLAFLKGSTAPLVLYVKEPQVLYDELVSLMVNQKSVVVEKETDGPIKKVCFLSNQLASVAIQEEQYI